MHHAVNWIDRCWQTRMQLSWDNIPATKTASVSGFMNSAGFALPSADQYSVDDAQFPLNRLLASVRINESGHQGYRGCYRGCTECPAKTSYLTYRCHNLRTYFRVSLLCLPADCGFAA